MRRPSTRTVQAPHCPRSQPFLVPVRCSCSRRRSSSVTLAVIQFDCPPLPLMVRVIDRLVRAGFMLFGDDPPSQCILYWGRHGCLNVEGSSVYKSGMQREFRT